MKKRRNIYKYVEQIFMKNTAVIIILNVRKNLLENLSAEWFKKKMIADLECIMYFAKIWDLPKCEMSYKLYAVLEEF